MKKGKRIKLPFADLRTGRRNYIIIPSQSPFTLEEFTEVYRRHFRRDLTERLVFGSPPAFVEHLETLRGNRYHLSSFHNSCTDGYRTLSLHYEIPDVGIQRVALYGWRRKDFKPSHDSNPTRAEFLARHADLEYWLKE